MSAPRTLARTLTLQFIWVAVAPLALVALLLTFSIAPRIANDIERRHQSLAATLVAQVNGYLHEPLAVLQGLRAYLEAHQSTPSELTTLFDAHITASTVFDAIYLTNANGAATVVGLPKSRQSFRDDYLGIDFKHREFFAQARQQKTPVWSDTFLSPLSGHVTVAMALSVGEQTLIAEIDLLNLSDFLNKIGSLSLIHI